MPRNTTAPKAATARTTTTKATPTATTPNRGKPTTHTQTVRIDGKRVRLVTRNGKVTMKAAPVLEIDLQIAAVRRLKAMPEYVSKATDVRSGTFTLAADQNGSGKRGRNNAVKLKAAGMAAGEPDLRVYFAGGVLRFIEFKGEKGRLEESQQVRFPLLSTLGFQIEVVEASSADEAEEKAVALVRGWLARHDAANDNEAAAKRCS